MFAVRREEESKVVDEEMGSIFPSESAGMLYIYIFKSLVRLSQISGVLGSVDSGHNTNADISS